MAKTILEAALIFVLSIGLLSVVYVIPQLNTHKAIGPWWYHSKGLVLMFVSVFYLVSGCCSLSENKVSHRVGESQPCFSFSWCSLIASVISSIVSNALTTTSRFPTSSRVTIGFN